jgi:Sulfotransferase domain
MLANAETMNSNRPGPLVVTSAMRTGSTWLVNMLEQIGQASGFYANNVSEALAWIGQPTGDGVVKSHGIIDLDWHRLPEHVPLLRITRNYKDSVISRAQYVKNIRPHEGTPVAEAEILALLAELDCPSEHEFIAAFVKQCPLVEDWLAEIVVMERSHSERCLAVMYESLMHNPYDLMLELTEAIWPGWDCAQHRVLPVVKQSLQDGLKKRGSFLRSKAVGVGGWELYLSPDQSERLDDMYLSLREIAISEPEMRWQDVLRLHRAHKVV